MDKTGAVIGLFIGAVVLYLSQRDNLTLTLETYLWLVLLAVLPGLASVVVLAGWVEEGSKSTVTGKPALAGLGSTAVFGGFIGVLVLFTLGNSSDAFPHASERKRSACRRSRSSLPWRLLMLSSAYLRLRVGHFPMSLDGAV